MNINRIMEVVMVGLSVGCFISAFAGMVIIPLCGPMNGAVLKIGVLFFLGGVSAFAAIGFDIRCLLRKP